MILLVSAVLVLSAVHTFVQQARGRAVAPPIRRPTRSSPLVRRCAWTSVYNTSVRDFLESACPAQVAHYTCYYHGNASHAQELEFRRYVPHQVSTNDPRNADNDDSTCLPFRLVEFLSLLRNRRVFFLGDSILGNLYVSLFCSLYHVAESHHRINFIKLYSCDKVLCPFDSESHSYNHADVLTFREYNASLFYFIYNQVDFDLRRVADHFGMTADDVLVINPGIHYNDRNLFTGHLRVLHSQLTGMWADRDFRARAPTVLFAESTPQHFPAQAEGQANGYYPQLTTGFQGERKCRPFVGPNSTAEERQRVYESDWRNRLVEQELGDLIAVGNLSAPLSAADLDQPFITRVPLAAGLYDQFDAHLESSPFVFVPYDCTHWCFPGGVDRYMHLMLYNALWRALRRTQQRQDLQKLIKDSAPVQEKWRHQQEQRDKSVKEHDRTWRQRGLPANLRAGSVVKVDRQQAIYFVNEQGQCQMFNSWSAFVSRGYDLSNVVSVTMDELRLMEEGPPLV
eukprot:gene9197-6614_t